MTDAIDSFMIAFCIFGGLGTLGIFAPIIYNDKYGLGLFIVVMSAILICSGVLIAMKSSRERKIDNDDL